MNTPPKIRRYTYKPLPQSEGLDGQQGYYMALTDPNYAITLAQIITSFVHLEESMQDMLAVVLDDDWKDSSLIIWNALTSNKVKGELIKALLEKSQKNVDLPIEFDQAIDEFAALNSLRNLYAHGKWWTRHGDGKVLFLPLREDSYMAVSHAKPVELERLIDAQKRIFKLINDIRSCCIQSRFARNKFQLEK